MSGIEYILLLILALLLITILYLTLRINGEEVNEKDERIAYLRGVVDLAVKSKEKSLIELMTKKNEEIEALKRYVEELEGYLDERNKALLADIDKVVKNYERY